MKRGVSQKFGKFDKQKCHEGQIQVMELRVYHMVGSNCAEKLIAGRMRKILYNKKIKE